MHTTSEPDVVEIDDRARTVALVVAAVAGAAFVLAALLLVPWGWVPGTTVEPVEPTALLTPEQVARAEEYSGVRRVLGWVAIVVSLMVAGWLALARSGRRVARAGAGTRWARPWWVRVVLGVVVVLVVGRAVVLPVSVLIRRRALDYGLTTQGWAAWLLDLVRSLAVEVAVTALALVVLVGLARRFRRAWPALAAVAVAGLVLAGSFLHPVLIEPVFNRFEPMPDGPLRVAILEVADAEGVEVDEVLVADASRRTTTLNAYVSGFGDTRRVVVYDTLLAGLTDEQALSVVAHEIAHARHDDVLLGTMLGALGGAAGVGALAWLVLGRRVRRRADVAGPGDPAVVALVLFLVGVVTFAANPVESGISRAIEARADVTALRATEDGDAFAQMQHRLASRSLSDPQPPAWSRWAFASHPLATERLGILEALGVSWELDPAAEARRAEQDRARGATP
ncbi:MAG: M48 family metalloprotease [Nocardioides sp.]|nr:M48 family metalloprotease [Nocardioides sp.]